VPHVIRSNRRTETNINRFKVSVVPPRGSFAKTTAALLSHVKNIEISDISALLRIT
jgi:hypothetical protein